MLSVLFRIFFPLDPFAGLIADRAAGFASGLAGASAFAASGDLSLRGAGDRFDLIHAVISFFSLFYYYNIMQKKLQAFYLPAIFLSEKSAPLNLCS